MPLDTQKPANYRRGWRGEAAAAHLQPDWTITVCDACLTATCWQGEFYCEKAKGAGTREITIAEARERNQENPTWWLKDEGIKRRLSAVCEKCGGGWGGYTACAACNGTGLSTTK